MRSKKAISPLVATILLIAFAIALGAVVMSWGIGRVNENAPAAPEEATLVPEECTSVEISLKYGIGEKPCYDTNDFVFAAFVDNGPKELSGIKVIVYGSSGVSEINEGVLNNQATIKEGDSVLIAANYGKDGSSIDKVEIIPKVRPYGASEEIACSSKKIEISNLKKSETCYK